MKFPLPKNTFMNEETHSSSSQKESDQQFFGKGKNPSPFFNSSFIQPKLSVDQPNDIYEKEADAMADEVVQGKPMQRKCGACTKEEQVSFKSETGSNAPATVESGLGSMTTGSPLPSDTRQEMEDSFGTDFSNVRIHNDHSAVQMSSDLHAQAFTHGSDIYFNSGKYDTNNKEGQHLLAHELTHTIQQGDEIRKQPNKAAPVKPEADVKSETVEPYSDEIYFARNDFNSPNPYHIVIPKSTTTVKQLAAALFVTDSQKEDAEEGASPLEFIGTSLKQMNGLTLDTVIPKEHILIGDLPTYYPLKPWIINLLPKIPIFPSSVFDPEAELNKMGVSNFEGFIKRKAELDLEVSLDAFKIMGLIQAISEESLLQGKQESREKMVLDYMRKWIAEPLTKYPHHYKDNHEYFDTILSKLTMKTFILKGLIVDEWTNMFSLMFNRFIFYKDELVRLKEFYSVDYKTDQPFAELSVWGDLVKPMIKRIPSAITEEASCFFQSIPLGVAKDIGSTLHGVAVDYNAAVMPEDKEGNDLSLAIACSAGGLMFDLAGGEIAEIKKLIDTLRDLQAFWDVYKGFAAIWDMIPKISESFDNKDIFLDFLFDLEYYESFDKLKLGLETLKGFHTEPTTGTTPPQGGLEKFKDLIGQVAGTLNNIVSPVFEIREIFDNVFDRVEAAFALNPRIIGFFVELIEKGIKSKDADLKQEIIDTLFQFLPTGNLIEEQITSKVSGFINSIKEKLIDSIDTYIIEKVSERIPTVRGFLAIKPIRDKLMGYMHEVSEEFFKLTGINDVIGNINSLVKKVTTPATEGLQSLLDNLKSALENIQFKEDETENDYDPTALTEVDKNMRQSTAKKLPDEARNIMDAGFGREFDQVNIHTDAAAALAASSLHAKAFTRGNDIYFKEGQFNESTESKKLLAHELTHVVQQHDNNANALIQRAGDELAKKAIKKVSKAALQRAGKGQYPIPDATLNVTLNHILPSDQVKDFDTALIDKLIDERRKKGYRDVELFRGTNIAVFKYIVLPPGATDARKTIGGGIESAPNTKGELHSEQKIIAKLDKLRKKFPPGAIIKITQVFSERKPCSSCEGIIRAPRDLVKGGDATMYYLVPYLDFSDRRKYLENIRQLIRKYGLAPPSIDDLMKK